jgi:phage tail protein X
MAPRRRQRGFDDIERGACVTLRSDKEIGDLIDSTWRRGFSRIRGRAESCLSAAPGALKSGLLVRRSVTSKPS